MGDRCAASRGSSHPAAPSRRNRGAHAAGEMHLADGASLVPQSAQAGGQTGRALDDTAAAAIAGHPCARIVLPVMIEMRAGHRPGSRICTRENQPRPAEMIVVGRAHPVGLAAPQLSHRCWSVVISRIFGARSVMSRHPYFIWLPHCRQLCQAKTAGRSIGWPLTVSRSVLKSATTSVPSAKRVRSV